MAQATMIRRLTATALLAVIRGYRLVLAPWVGRRCRFLPSCSSYALEAIREHGPWRGSALTLRRLVRCHPWGGHGYDPVPQSHRAPPVAADEPARNGD